MIGLLHVRPKLTEAIELVVWPFVKPTPAVHFIILEPLEPPPPNCSTVKCPPPEVEYGPHERELVLIK